VWLFLILLLPGFTLNAASAFTAAYSRRWGERGGRWASFILRNILGIPVWAMGLGLAVQTPSAKLVASTFITNAVGWLLIAAGGVVILWALGPLGKRSVAPSVRDTVVTHGAYARVRHPIHSGTFLEFVGLWLLRPTVVAGVAYTQPLNRNGTHPRDSYLLSNCSPSRRLGSGFRQKSVELSGATNDFNRFASLREGRLSSNSAESTRFPPGRLRQAKARLDLNGTASTSAAAGLDYSNRKRHIAIRKKATPTPASKPTWGNTSTTPAPWLVNWR
jgi:protein-S-isoprenylcysteine O-methyltransferase Ste14